MMYLQYTANNSNNLLKNTKKWCTQFSGKDTLLFHKFIQTNTFWCAPILTSVAVIKLGDYKTVAYKCSLVLPALEDHKGFFPFNPSVQRLRVLLLPRTRSGYLPIAHNNPLTNRPWVAQKQLAVKVSTFHTCMCRGLWVTIHSSILSFLCGKFSDFGWNSRILHIELAAASDVTSLKFRCLCIFPDFENRLQCTNGLVSPC